MSKKIINANKNLNLRMSAGSVIQRQEPKEWSSSDEETLERMNLQLSITYIVHTILLL
jgi:hypothetical protein